MKLAYSGRSAPSAQAIAEASDGDIQAVRSGRAGINWGRNHADSELNADISNSTNKRRMRELFAEHEVPTPKLYDCPRYAIDQGIVLVGRPDRHMKGRGYWLCQSRDDVDRAVRGTRRKAAATHFMEFIDAPREYRVHIFKGKSIRISEKDTTAFHEYTTIKPTNNVKHVRKAAKAAIAALGLDFGAVDVLANDEQAWVLECNAAPGLGGSMARLYAEVFNQWENGEFDE